MIPVWLQLVVAVSAGLLSFLTGAVLIPVLKRCRCCIPESEKKSDSESGENADAGTMPVLRPVMCGFALISGTLAGLVAGNTLYLSCCHADRTALSFQQENRVLRALLFFALLAGLAGFLMDYLMVRRSHLYSVHGKQLYHVICLILLAGSCCLFGFLPEQILDFGFWKWNAGWLSAPVRAFCFIACFHLMQLPESEADGTCITVSTVQLLCIGILLLSARQNLYALCSLAGAGACMGCFFWNLHPAKCRLGNTGLFWLGALLPALYLLCGNMQFFLLYIAVYVVNFLPAVTFSADFHFRYCPQRSLTCRLKQNGCKPLQSIALLAGFALFSGILMLVQSKQ